MMFVLRHRLVSIAALTAYLVVNVGAGALHHHHGAALRPGKVPTACGTDLQFQTAGQAGDADDEETCLLCSVLHLPQTSPGEVHVEVLIVPTGEAFSAAAILQPHLLETPTRARSPPTA
jgi:hypothetical protein